MGISGGIKMDYIFKIIVMKLIVNMKTRECVSFVVGFCYE